MKFKMLVMAILFFVMGIFVPGLISGNDTQLCIGLAIIAVYFVVVYFVVAPHINKLKEKINEL